MKIKNGKNKRKELTTNLKKELKSPIEELYFHKSSECKIRVIEEPFPPKIHLAFG